MPELSRVRLAVIGAGPAGLMAAEAACAKGDPIDVYDAMPSAGRKFLMAGKGGLNITHAEPFADFCTRFGARQNEIRPMLEAYGPGNIRRWMETLGIESFTGSSGRVFPQGMKAAPLLRAWLHRLRADGVRFHMRHRWQEIERQASGAYALRFSTPDGDRLVVAQAVVFALGGGSWAKLGSDGQWTGSFATLGIPVAPLRPANCGFDARWSDYFRERFAGSPVKNISVSLTDSEGILHSRRGEFIVTGNGVEGSLIYALSSALRDILEASGSATLTLDLLPQQTLAEVQKEIAHPRGSRSLGSHLQSRLGLKGVKAALLRECLPAETFADAASLGAAIKALPLRLCAPRPLAEAISSAGGVHFEALDDRLMLRGYPGLFCAGEMLDWEAPTGGYLLTGCFASGRTAGLAARAWLESIQTTTAAS